MDEEKAKEWAKDYFSEMDKEISGNKNYSTTIKRIKSQQADYDFNYYMRQTGGEIEDFDAFLDLTNHKDYLIEDRDNIISMFDSKNSKLNDNIYVYHNMNLEDSQIFNDEQFKTDNGINRAFADHFSDNFFYGKLSEYLSVNLFDTEASDNELIKCKLLLPKGSQAIHIGDGKLILDKNYSLEVTDMTLVTEKGKEKIQVDAKLIDKEDTKLFEVRAFSQLASLTSMQLDKLLEDMNTNLDENVLKVIMDYIKDNNGKVLITDLSLGFIKELYPPDPINYKEFSELDDSIGVFNYNSYIVALCSPKSFNEIARINGDGTLFHELGHVLDKFCGEQLDEKDIEFITDTDVVKQIYRYEGKSLTEYASQNIRDFFAEAYRLMHSSNLEEVNWVKNDAPNIYQFIKELEDEIINHS